MVRIYFNAILWPMPSRPVYHWGSMKIKQRGKKKLLFKPVNIYSSNTTTHKWYRHDWLSWLFRIGLTCAIYILYIVLVCISFCIVCAKHHIPITFSFSSLSYLPFAHHYDHKILLFGINGFINNICVYV